MFSFEKKLWMGKFSKLFESLSGNVDNLREGIDYCRGNGYRVMTERYLVNRGWCCASGCCHCPYRPKAQKGNTNLKEGITRS